MILIVAIVAAVLIGCVAVMVALLVWSAEDEPPATLESGQSHLRTPPR